MEHEVIIVGAGPAGLSTGLHLAQLTPALAGHTLILERAHHPRPKLCAGGIMPPGEDWLRKLGLDPTEVPAVEVREAHVILDDTCLDIHNEPYIFRVVRRELFDAWLAAAARERGLALQEGTRVRRVRCLENVVEVETERGTYRAHAVVGADGANGVVRRAIARNHPSPVSRLLEVCMFRPMPTIDSDGCRPLVPSHADHPLQRHADHFSEPIGIGGRHRSDSVDDIVRIQWTACPES